MRKILTALTIAVLITSTVSGRQTPENIPDPGRTPGDLLYGLERASESLELIVAGAPLIGGPELKAKVRANHAAERLAEAKTLAEENKTGKVEKLMEEYSEGMNKSVENARKTGQDKLPERLSNISSNQENTLREVKNRVPEQKQKAVQKAIENSQKQRKTLSETSGGRKTGAGKPENKNIGKDEKKPDRTPETRPENSKGETSTKTENRENQRKKTSRSSEDRNSEDSNSSDDESQGETPDTGSRSSGRTLP